MMRDLPAYSVGESSFFRIGVRIQPGQQFACPNAHDFELRKMDVSIDEARQNSPAAEVHEFSGRELRTRIVFAEALEVFSRNDQVSRRIRQDPVNRDRVDDGCFEDPPNVAWHSRIAGDPCAGKSRRG